MHRAQRESTTVFVFFHLLGIRKRFVLRGTQKGQTLRAYNNIQAQVYVYMCVIRNTQMIVKLHALSRWITAPCECAGKYRPKHLFKGGKNVPLRRVRLSLSSPSCYVAAEQTVHTHRDKPKDLHSVRHKQRPRSGNEFSHSHTLSIDSHSMYF